MTIQEIKSRLSIGAVLGHYNLEPSKNGMLCCPFHADQKASMKIYGETNTVYCFSGSCSVQHLDVIDFILQIEKSSKHEAIEKAKGLIDPFHKKSIKKSIKNSIKIKKGKMESNQKSDKTQRFTRYVKSLELYQLAKDYLLSRGLDRKVLEVGYKSVKMKGGWGKNCIIFPLKDAAGNIVSFYGRSIKEDGHFYETGRSGLYPSYPKAETKILVLCESIIDTVSLLQLDKMNVYTFLSMYGTNGLTAEHKEAISRLLNLEEIIFALDGDEAGRKSTLSYAKQLAELHPKLKLSSLDLPEGEDVNSLFIAHEDRAGLFSDLFANRKLLTKGNVSKLDNSPKLNTLNKNSLVYQTSLAKYSIKGGVRCSANDFDHLKVSLEIENEIGRKSRQRLDLYEDKQVEKCSRIAGEKLGLRADLLELDLQLLTDALEKYREDLHEKGVGNKSQLKEKIEVPNHLRSSCLSFLKQPKLLDQINEEIGKSGIIGEEVNRLLLFVVASSYSMEDTLHALIQGSSGSGKTRLLQVIAELMPPEKVKRYTRVTDSSFYNQGEYFFVNKLICLEDMDGLKEEAQLAVRELQSNKILVTSTSIKDEHGRISGGERTVRGPIASLSCTTKSEVYEDNISRCFVVAVDESKEQSLRIIAYQNQKSAGIIEKGKEQEAKLFMQNCMRLIQPYEVINPYAHKIRLPESAHKIRRLNELYQSFVKQATLLNQYQRKRDRQGRLMAEKEDLIVACEILFESIVLKVDELDGSLRQFFEDLKKYIKKKGENYEFGQREIRLYFRVSKSGIQRYIYHLLELEYIEQRGFANRGYRYKISYWDDNVALRGQLKLALRNQLEKL